MSREPILDRTSDLRGEAAGEAWEAGEAVGVWPLLAAPRDDAALLLGVARDLAGDTDRDTETVRQGVRQGLGWGQGDRE